MMFQGRVWKDGTFWLAEMELADVMTQGRTRKEALAMLGDALGSLVNRKGFDVVVEGTGEDVLVKASDPAALIALAFKRQREKHGLSLADVAKALGQTSRNSYARYERGTSVPTLDKIDELFRAVAPERPVVLSMRPRAAASGRKLSRAS